MDIELDELIRRRDELTVLDVRTPGEYSGEAGYPCDPRQGHIPGARQLEVGELLARSPEEIRSLVGLPEGAEIVTYCHSGSRSEHAAQALRAAGYDARNYAGSWHEWSRDESLPAEGGSEAPLAAPPSGSPASPGIRLQRPVDTPEPS